MARSGKYGRVDIPRIGDNEPVFILRAQDRLAEAAIRIYKVLAQSHGSSVAETLDTEIDRFRNWTGSKKLPDQAGGGPLGAVSEMRGQIIAVEPAYHRVAVQSTTEKESLLVDGVLSSEVILQKGEHAAALTDFSVGDQVVVQWETTDRGLIIKKITT